jgi:spore photoproduct lyase
MVQYKRFKGSFIKHCPCSPGAVSCGYLNINLHTGCPYHCTYCILQVYLDTKAPVFYTNLADLRQELQAVSKKQSHIRIGTGELSDSLAWDNTTRYSGKIIEIIDQFPDIIFEFKTKSTNIHHLLAQPRALKNIVVSWSLNPQVIIDTEEIKTPSLQARLQAMKAVQERGYRIGIHMDPLIYTPGWQPAYEKLVKTLATSIRADKIAWWSLGALRFPPQLRPAILKNKHSMLFYGELIKGFDGKFRYYRPQRLELFNVVIRAIQRYFSRDIPLYLCMEDAACWAAVLPHLKGEEGWINQYLYQSAMR